MALLKMTLATLLLLVLVASAMASGSPVEGEGTHTIPDFRDLRVDDVRGFVSFNQTFFGEMLIQCTGYSRLDATHNKQVVVFPDLSMLKGDFRELEIPPPATFVTCNFFGKSPQSIVVDYIRLQMTVWARLDPQVSVPHGCEISCEWKIDFPRNQPYGTYPEGFFVKATTYPDYPNYFLVQTWVEKESRTVNSQHTSPLEALS